MRLKLTLVLLVLSLGCEPDAGTSSADEIIAALQAGEIVEIPSVVESDGILISESSKAVTTGCFGFDWCVRMDDLNRGIVSLATDDFTVYAEESSEEPPSGITYFSTNFYSPYWATNGNYHAMRALVDLAGGGYTGKRIGWCNNHPERCVQEE